MKKNSLESLFNEAVSLHQKNQLEQAQIRYEEVLKIDANHSDALHLLGVIFLSYQEYAKSLEFIDKALLLNPHYATAYSNRGIVLQALHRYDEALENYDHAIALNPNHARAHYNRANILHRLQRYGEAIKSFSNALKLDPNHGDTYFHLANSLKALHKYEEALVCYDHVMCLDPNRADIYAHQGAILHVLQRPLEALECYNHAIVANPNDAVAYSNRGYALQGLSRYKEALENYNHALSLDANYVDAYWNKSLLLLLLGDLHHGFALYEWRWQTENFTSFKRAFTQPVWLGKEELKGKTILIHAEQGLGDTLQFCRYIEHVKNLGATIIFEVNKPLYPFLQQLAGVDHWVCRGEVLPHFDFHAPLLSLPLAFGTTLNTIPTLSLPLRADDAKSAYWREKLSPITGAKIGIVWSGSTIHKDDTRRSIALEVLLNYLPNEFHYISLQKELRALDQETLNHIPNVHFFGDELHDFTDTAGLCACMDLIISVDTSVAHLSCSMNQETIILLPFVPDWRWLEHRSDSPWYPSAHLLRQQNINDWESCLTHLPTLLRQKFKKEG